MNISTIKHRSASGTLTSLWEYDPQRRVIMVTLRGRSFDIPVCSERNPRHSAYAISRKNETLWQVAPAMYARMRDGSWTSVAVTFDNGQAEFLHLTHAPDAVSAELGKLDHERTT